jgi:hypothetical protein
VTQEQAGKRRHVVAKDDPDAGGLEIRDEMPGEARVPAVADALRDFDLALTELPLSPDRLARALRESRLSRG